MLVMFLFISLLFFQASIVIVVEYFSLDIKSARIFSNLWIHILTIDVYIKNQFQKQLLMAIGDADKTVQ
jgi:hypothetical protein